MQGEFFKFAVSILAAALSAYGAIRSDLVELRTTVSFHTSQIEKIDRKLEK
jgi:hypothetical protein